MKPIQLKPFAVILGTLLVGIPAVTMAHTGVGAPHGFAHGFVHPLAGLDHALAMVAVGFYAASLGGRSLWLVPTSFVLMMLAGGALAMTGVQAPLVETGIGVSVVVLGLAVALRWSLPAAVAAALAGFFAIFHGYAHGAEMQSGASVVFYALGFLLATVLLHAAGIGLGRGLERLGTASGRVAASASGGLMAVAGIGFLTGSL